MPGKPIAVPGKPISIPVTSFKEARKDHNQRSQYKKAKPGNKDATNKWATKAAPVQPTTESTGATESRKSKKTETIRQWRQEQKALRAAARKAKSAAGTDGSVEPTSASSSTATGETQRGVTPPNTSEVRVEEEEEGVNEGATAQQGASGVTIQPQRSTNNSEQTSSTEAAVDAESAQGGPSSAPPAVAEYKKRKRQKKTPQTPQYEASSSSDSDSDPTPKKRRRNLSQLENSRKRTWKYNANLQAPQQTEITRTQLAPTEDHRIHSKSWHIPEFRIELSTYDKGPFTTYERQQIERAVTSYLTDKSIPRSDLHLLINKRIKHPSMTHALEVGGRNPYKSAEYADFLPYVVEKSGVNRDVRHTYEFLSRTYSTCRNDWKPWTDEDDAVLKALRERGMKWSDIMRDMGRSNVKERFRMIDRYENDMNTGKWSTEEERQFAKACRDNMVKNELEDIWEINDWTEIAAQMGTRDAKQCQVRFPILIDKYGTLDNVEEPKAGMNRSWRRQDDLDLVTKMLTLCGTANDESDISWESLRGKGWRRWSIDHLKLRWISMRRRVPNMEIISFREALQYCVDNMDVVSKVKEYRSEEFIFDSDEEVEDGEGGGMEGRGEEGGGEGSGEGAGAGGEEDGSDDGEDILRRLFGAREGGDVGGGNGEGGASSREKKRRGEDGSGDGGDVEALAPVKKKKKTVVVKEEDLDDGVDDTRSASTGETTKTLESLGAANGVGEAERGSGVDGAEVEGGSRMVKEKKSKKTKSNDKPDDTMVEAAEESQTGKAKEKKKKKKKREDTLPSLLTAD
ncbi:Cyclin-D-binding Myb-like transcription factor 1 [Rhizophlyctis rosea]|nr:Cyclin-D-binding Myb-like transcription factor 1 [Rhizophlyctis rosea]